MRSWFFVFQHSPLALLCRDFRNEEAVSPSFGISFSDRPSDMLTFKQGGLVDGHPVSIARHVQPQTPTALAADVRKDDVPHEVACIGDPTFELSLPLRREFLNIFMNLFKVILFSPSIHRTLRTSLADRIPGENVNISRMSRSLPLYIYQRSWAVTMISTP